MKSLLQDNVFFYALVAALIILALLLGLNLLWDTDQNQDRAERNGSVSLDDTQAEDDASAGKENYLPLDIPEALRGELTEDELTVLRTPTQHATEDARRQHFLLAQELAVESDTFTITGCIADPVVIAAPEHSTITVVNNDDSEHQLQFSPDYIFPIPANGQAEIEVEFGFGPGTYGYGCDNSTGARGVFMVTVGDDA